MIDAICAPRAKLLVSPASPNGSKA
jgi:hypothetical protein